MAVDFTQLVLNPHSSSEDCPGSLVASLQLPIIDWPLESSI